MSACVVCKKSLNQEASVSIHCIDCTNSMSKSNTDSMETIRNKIKKENLIIKIFTAIGAVGGIVFGVIYGLNSEEGISIFFLAAVIGIWCLSGIGTGLGYLISGFTSIGYKRWGFGLFFPVIGFFLGIFLFLFCILRRNYWIKKFNEIIASENTAITEFDGYIQGKKIDTSDLYGKLYIIGRNFEIIQNFENTSSGIPLNHLKELYPAEAKFAKEKIAEYMSNRKNDL